MKDDYFIRKATKRRPYRADPLESEIHLDIARYLNLVIKRPSRWHTVEVSNQGQGVAAMIKQQALKARGVRTGWPDICLYWINPDSDGWGKPELRIIFMEVKSPKGTLTEKQKELHQELKEDGHAIHVVRSVEDVKAVLKDLGVI